MHRANKRFRTKPEICRDVAYVLTAPLSVGTKTAVLNDAIWTWSEFDGKFEGCKFWSSNALCFRGNRKLLVHEHLVPRKVLIDWLLELSAPSIEVVSDIFENFCVGVIVTKDEDLILNKLGLRASMPDAWKREEPWARYRVAGIVANKVEQ
jgi:hypothetical protein